MMHNSDFELEKAHLIKTSERLDHAIAQMEIDSDKLISRIKEQNKQMGEQLGSAPGDFAQMAEFNQFLMMEKQLLEQNGFHHKKFELYKKLREKLYFGRIDYRENDTSSIEPLYIGYGNFMDDHTLEIYIYDWRTPIASIYYDYQTGPVSYTAPEGIIEGEVFLKRQFEIINGQLISYFDASVHQVDERLIDVLSQKKSGYMGNIVETIQAEQNRIIREKVIPNIFVEGIAGSGKTVVALHRIAYLMYHGLKNHISAHQVLVLSPNALFSDYISRVIPDLGEDQVRTMQLTDVIEAQMNKYISHEHPYHRLEREWIYGTGAIEKKADSIKQSAAMKKLLTFWIASYPERYLAFEDLYYQDVRVAQANEMRSIVCDPKSNRPLAKRLMRYAERVQNKAKDYEKTNFKSLVQSYRDSGHYPFDYQEAAQQESQRRFQLFADQLRKSVVIDALMLYKKLLKTPQAWYAIFKDVSHDVIDQICKFTLTKVENGRMSQIDLVNIAYLHYLIHGETPFKDIKHVVIDESQDYGVMSFALLKLLFEKAHFTILGDSHQTLQDVRNKSLHEQVSDLFGQEQSAHMNLTVGYRNDLEIGALCLSLFEGEKEYQMVDRKGEKPIVFQNANGLKDALSYMKAKDYQTLAIITKTMQEAQVVYERIQVNHDVELVTEHTKALLKGILVIPIYLAKGMEFDAVILYEVNAQNYYTENDRQLLYVGCSRALHALCLQTSSDLSPIFKAQEKRLIFS